MYLYYLNKLYISVTDLSPLAFLNIDKNSSIIFLLCSFNFSYAVFQKYKMKT